MHIELQANTSPIGGPAARARRPSSSTPRLRSAIARIVTTTGSYIAGQWACARLAGGFILAYHDLPADDFERQIDALRPNEPVHLSELFQRAHSGRSTAGLFAVTLDDGVAATVRDISSACRRRGWPITFYLPTIYLDEHRGLPFQLWQKVVPHLPRAMLSLQSRALDLATPEAFARFTRGVETAMFTQPNDTYRQLIADLVQWVLDHELATPDQLAPPEPIPWSEVVELSKDDVIRFESHGVTHTAVVALSPAELQRELRTSKRRISEHTNRDCRHFCYPFGGMESIGVTAPSIVAEEYETAVTMNRGRLGRHPWFLMPRIPVYERDDPDVARLKILTV